MPLGTRIELQPTITITPATTNIYQEARFAGRLPGGAKSGLFLLNIFATSLVAGSMKIFTASDLALDNIGAATGFWAANSGVLSTLTATGLKSVTLGPLTDFIRWGLESGTTGSITFSIVLYAYAA